MHNNITVCNLLKINYYLNINFGINKSQSLLNFMVGSLPLYIVMKYILYYIEEFEVLLFFLLYLVSFYDFFSSVPFVCAKGGEASLHGLFETNSKIFPFFLSLRRPYPPLGLG